MSKKLNKIRRYVKKNPARLSGYISAFTIYLYHSLPTLNSDLIMFLMSIFIGLGEASQRAEDKKTIAAIYFKSKAEIPDDKMIDHFLENHIRKYH